MSNAIDTPLDYKHIGIVGSREFPSLELVKNFVYALPKTVTVHSGGAKGVDSYAVEMARRRGIAFIEHKPDKKLPSPERYYKRNRQIVRNSDLVVLFWDGESGGTKYTKEFCEKTRREHIVITKDGTTFNFPKPTWPLGMYDDEE